MIEKNENTVRKSYVPGYQKMVPTPNATGKGCTGWSWRRFVCSICQAEVPYNKCVDHYLRKHNSVWMAFVGSVQAFVDEYFDEVEVIK